MATNTHQFTPDSPSGFAETPAAPYNTYSNYAQVGSPQWLSDNGISHSSYNGSMSPQNNPWTSTQLAQANGIMPGLAEYMLNQDHGNGGTQFLQSAGFTNAPGSRTTMDQAGTNWMFANDPTYGGAVNPATGKRTRFGMTSNGTPYSYGFTGVDPAAINRWAMTGGQGPAPTGVTAYNQFSAAPGSEPTQQQSYGAMANLNSTVPNTNPTGNNTQPGGMGPNYTGFGNSVIAGPAPAGPTNLPPSSGSTANYPGPAGYSGNNNPNPNVPASAGGSGPNTHVFNASNPASTTPPPGYTPPSMGMSGTPPPGVVPGAPATTPAAVGPPTVPTPSNQTKAPYSGATASNWLPGVYYNNRS